MAAPGGHARGCLGAAAAGDPQGHRAGPGGEADRRRRHRRRPGGEPGEGIPDHGRRVLGFLALKTRPLDLRRGRFVFTDWYDFHAFAARRDRLEWLAEQGAGLEKEARRTRLAVVGDGYRWPAG